MSSLTGRERQLLSKVFNNGGYVFDFTNSSFADFCLGSIGIDIQEKYGLSKGASLDAFIAQEDDWLVGKLIIELIQYRKDMVLLNDAMISSGEEAKMAECSRIAERLVSSNVEDPQYAMIKESSFSTAYISQHVELMYKMLQEDNTTEAIGKAKELVESCAKTILRERSATYSKTEDYTSLVNRALKVLKLKRESVSDDKKASGTIKTILSSLTQIVCGLEELRNSYGSGHGKENDYSGLSQRHARLAVGSSVTAVMFMWDTHCAMGTMEYNIKETSPGL